MGDISSRLRAAEPGTTLYVGHDSDIMMVAGALGLTWNATPYTGLVTLPGSMLRFDLDDNTISASYSYVANFSDANVSGEMSTATVHFSDGSIKMSMDTFQNLAEKNTIAECASDIKLTPSSEKTAEFDIVA